ncbi:glycosyltransferase family 39 protein [Candidatus Parcubacteria bacterium]|nr:glycosyltransferase family 39 protein [Candidatus Parcubacteria bacterium]
MNKKGFISRNKYLILIFIIAILLRGIFFTAVLNNFGDKGFYPHNSDDSEQYWELAKNFAEYNVFSRSESPPFVPELFRTPGYPFFISIFYRVVPFAWLAIVFQNIIALFSILLIYKLTMLLFHKKFIALLAAAIYAIEPTTIYWNNQLLSETLFTFALLLSVYCFVRYVILDKKYFLQGALVTGALVAITNYVRPAAQFILILFIIFSFANLKINFKSIFRHISIALLIVVSFFILSFPWLARSKILFNTYDFASSTSSVGFKRYMYMMYVNQGKDVSELDSIELSLQKSTALKYVIMHPVVFAKIHLLSFAPFLMSDGYFTVASVFYPPLEEQRVIREWSGSWNELSSYIFGHSNIEAILFFGGKAILLILNLFALFGIIYWFFVFKKYRLVPLFFIFMIYYFILASGVTAYSRLRQPVNPYIYIFIALGVYWMLKSLKSKKINQKSLN